MQRGDRREERAPPGRAPRSRSPTPAPPRPPPGRASAPTRAGARCARAGSAETGEEGRHDGRERYSVTGSRPCGGERAAHQRRRRVAVAVALEADLDLRGAVQRVAQHQRRGARVDVGADQAALLTGGDRALHRVEPRGERPVQCSKSATRSTATFASCRPSPPGRRASSTPSTSPSTSSSSVAARGRPHARWPPRCPPRGRRELGGEVGIEQRAGLGAGLGGQALRGAGRGRHGARECWDRGSTSGARRVYPAPTPISRQVAGRQRRDVPPCRPADCGP